MKPGERRARGKKKNRVAPLSRARTPSVVKNVNFARNLFRARARPSTANSQRQRDIAVREQINKPCLFSRLRVNAQGLGLKRSVTTLRGGTLGYAEIVALKVNRPPPPRKARHASRCRDPDGRPPIIPSIASPLFLTHHLVIVQHCRSRRRFFSSSSHPPSPLSPPPIPCYITCMSVYFVSARRRIHSGCATGRISPSSCSLASRCLVRCFRCSVLSLVYTKRSASPVPDRRIGASLFPIDHRSRDLNVISEGIYFKTRTRKK